MRIVCSYSLPRCCHVINEVRDGTSDVNEQVWELHQRHHEFEKVGVIIEITLRHEPHVMQIRGKDTCIFKDSTVLYDCILWPWDVYNITKSLVKEVYLEIERPSFHVVIVIFQVWIVVNWLEMSLPSVTFSEHFGECCLTCSDVTCYCKYAYSLMIEVFIECLFECNRFCFFP